MDRLDQLLREEVSRCMERIAGTFPEGTLPLMTAQHPRLCGRLDDVEARLAQLRAEIVDRHAAWQAALGEMENLWALAALKGAGPGAQDTLKSAA